MSNALIEKRQELTNTLNALENDRQARIEEKVAQYRQAIESQFPTDNIEKVKRVIAALDEVINFENTGVAQTQEVVQPQHVEARPGMTEVFIPQRS